MPATHFFGSENGKLKKFSPRLDPMVGGSFGHISADIPEWSLTLAEHMLEARRGRLKHFDGELFGEPGWDMLMAIYIAHARGYRMTVTDMCFESGVPQTTALRWLNYIEERALIERKRKYLSDGRTVLVSLTPLGLEKMNAYLEQARATLFGYHSETIGK